SAKTRAKSVPASGGGSRSRASNSARGADRPVDCSDSVPRWCSTQSSVCTPSSRPAVGSGCGSGAAQARRRRSRGGSVIGVGLALGFGGAVGGDVPAAVVAGGCLVIASVAVKRAAVEELFESFVVVGGQVAGVARQRQGVATAVAVTHVQLGQEWE